MNADIHRLLDEAFAGVEMTPDAQDLKEEVRANLVARTAELEAAGTPSSDAARKAIAELGDVSELLDGTDAASPAASSAQTDFLRHRVRPKPGFVVRVVVWSFVFVVGLTLAVLGATGVLPLPVGIVIALLGVASAGLALVVGDSLTQETTTNHPMPESRAGGYALATFLGMYGLGFAGLIALGQLQVWTVVFACVGVIGAIVIFAFLGATQTNRRKAWVRTAQYSQPVSNRFEDEPETAARFGIYTVVLWLVTIGIMVALALTVGWWWALLAFVGGVAAMMLMLGRMLFGPRKS
jgi:hypothetical protein